MSAIVIDVETRANLRPLGDGLSAATAKATEFEKSINAANARVLAFGASAGLIYKMGEAFTSLIQSTISVEKSLIEVNTLLNKGQSDLASFGAELFSVAKQSAQSFDVVAEAAKELARQGLTSEQVIGRTSEAMNLMRLSGLQASSSVETLTAVLNTFSEANLTATSAVEKMAAIDAKFAVSSSQLAEGLKRSSAAAVDAGLSYEELLGVIAVVQERTARGGAVIGNALKSIFTRLQRTEVLDDLRNLGIEVENTQGEILPMIQILKNLSVSYQSLAPASKAFIGEQVAGVYQIGTLKALMADLSKENSRFSETQAVAANSSGSTAKRIEQLNTSLDAYIVRLNESARAFGAAFGGIGLSSGLKDLASVATSILESLTPDPKNSEEMGHKIGVGIMKGLGSFLTGPGLLGAAFIGGKILIKFFTDAAQAASSLASIGNVINQELAQRQSLESAIALHLAKQPAVMEQIKNGTFNIANAQNAILNQLREEERLRISIRNISNQMAGPLSQANIRAHSGAGNPPSGMYSKRSRGFIPNFDFYEVRDAISLGASKSVQAVPGKGNIGGKPFIANDQEKQIPNFLGSGQTAVIPRYGGGEQKAEQMIERGQSGPILGARGFVPNFATIIENAAIKGLEIPSSPRTVGSLIGGLKGSGKAYKGLAKDRDSYNVRPTGEVIHDTDTIFSPNIEVIDLTKIQGEGKGGDQIKALLKEKKEAEQAARKAIQGIEGKIAQFERSPTSRVAKDASGNPIRHGGNSALDIIGSNILGEVRAGNFKMSHAPIIQEKFQRFAVQNPNSRHLSPPGFTYRKNDAVKYLEGKYRLYVGGIKAASGFIPNFSEYKAGVSDLEEKLSGEKATFHKNPFPHFRNESQPTFESAIHAHGGLNHALKHSFAAQKAAGLISNGSNGYVPNFADNYKLPADIDIRSMGGHFIKKEVVAKLEKLMNENAEKFREGRITLDTFNKKKNELLRTLNLNMDSFSKLHASTDNYIAAQNKAAKATNQATNQAASDKTMTNMDRTMRMGMISMAASTASGAISEIAGADSTAGRAVSGLANVASYTAMGAAFGGVGAPVGAVIGAAIEGFKFFNADKTKELALAQEKNSIALNKFEQAIHKAEEASNEFSNATTDAAREVAAEKIAREKAVALVELEKLKNRNIISPTEFEKASENVRAGDFAKGKNFADAAKQRGEALKDLGDKTKKDKTQAVQKLIESFKEEGSDTQKIEEYIGLKSSLLLMKLRLVASMR